MSEGKRRAESSRRLKIATEAGQLFRQHGFANVAVADITRSVGVTAPALYRHFSSKEAVLAAAIETGLGAVEEVMADTAGQGIRSVLTALARVAVDRPDIWILIRRESAYLGEDGQQEVRNRFASFVASLRSLVAAERPELDDNDVDLVARAAVAAMAAPSQYPQRSRGTALSTVLADIAYDAVEVDLSASTAIAAPYSTASTPVTTTSRREQILVAAARLFAESGYDNVSLGAIGSAVDMSGPSIYHHFDSKAQILSTVLRRAVRRIDLDRERTQQEHGFTEASLTQSIQDYLALAATRYDLFRIFTSETMHLPAAEQVWIHEALKNYVSELVDLLVALRPSTSTGEAHARITAALSVINDLAESRRHRDSPETIGKIGHLAAVPLATPAG
ncbi:TetR/AcrR family transcriptional regulator [Nocardioides marmoriginsengisoli]|uniref:TetR/AcrR family transcriptional regulator n=1 Tax=Nocardioides marmoriginsengisoli TaxID=661483 RepID=A0A3N0CH61_9ACTN|nr:TetR/AcrR family transcriptional regulator [Nocardioides marmoriginsengisoli]RNL62782.1 TetR/AcrR family transcriptional regulator [Nocardioides marmoriginsengisoli]